MLNIIESEFEIIEKSQYPEEATVLVFKPRRPC
jgi:hypothetical protein